MQNLSGRKLGNYELRERLGRGGMAEVYKAYQSSMDRYVAVKVMLGHLAGDENFIERFKREAQAVGKLRHPHIIDIFDFGIEDDVYFMAMEYLTDGNLKNYIDTHETLELKDSLKITRDLADALDYAHKAGMIHRDLKPANVMFLDRAKMNVVLTDFGIARILNAVGLTGTGMAVGTPAYMSPEAGAGADADERADIYALGIILYEMLVGKVPYDADTPLAVIMKHINAPLPTRNDYGDNIPEQVERIMLKCLAKDPDDRYSTAGELRDALDDVLVQADNLAKTESVKAEKQATRLSSSDKTERAAVIDDDSPTKAIGWADTEAIPEESKSNPMMLYGIIAVVAVLIIAGLFIFRDSLFGTGDEQEPTAIAEVIETEESTASPIPEEPTDVPEPTDIPEEPTDVPEPTDIPEEPTDVPEPTDAPQATAVPTELPAPSDDVVATPSWYLEMMSSVSEMTVLPDPIAPPHEWNIELLSRGISFPPLSLIYSNRIEQMLFDGRLAEAIEVTNSAIEDSDPEMVELEMRVRIAVATGDFNTALETAEFMYELDRGNPNAHINLLDALYMLPPSDSQYEWAREILEEGQALTPPEDFSFVWRRIPLVDSDEEKMELFNRAEGELGARGWRFVLFAGNFLFEQGDYLRALPYLESASQLPHEIFYLRGRVEQQLQYAEAQRTYMALYPDYPLTLGGLMPPNPQNLSVFSNINPILDEAEAIVFAGDWDAALDYTNGYVEADPDSFDALFARSQIWSMYWDDENIAGQDAQRLIELEPDNVLSYIALADSYFNYPLADEEGSFEEGFSALEHAYEIAPDNPHVLFRLAVAGDWEQYAERLYRAEELGASGYRFIFNMGEFLHASGQYHRAIPYLELHNRYTDPDNYLNDESFWLLLGALMQADQADAALDYLLNDGVLDNTGEPELLTDGAFVAYRAGEYDLAEEWANTALAFSGEAYGARWILGNIAYYRDRDVDRAFENLEFAFNESDGGSEIYSRFLYFDYGGNDLNLERARILMHEERYEDAIFYYNEVLSYYDYIDWLYAERADAYIALEEIESARQDLQTAFEISEDPDYRAYLRERIVDLGPASDD